ncbi:MAG: glutamate synthase subunit beta [Anaerotardibacter sp.]
MGKPTGFIDYQRENTPDISPAQRVINFDSFHKELSCEERIKQAGRCMDCGVPFCQAGITIDNTLIGCPLKNLIPEWNDQLWRGNLAVALERLTRTNCFPEFTGYVCPAPCEGACSCGKVNAPVSINDNERYIIEKAFEQGLMTPKPPCHRSDEKIAVVGSGPAGLTIATLLNRRGHSVTVFERNATPGGLLVYGIPNMKLPKEVVARRIALLEEEGVEFKCGVDVGAPGSEVTLQSLQESYDAVVLAIGAYVPREVPYEGTSTDAHFVLDYLESVAKDQLGEDELDPQYNASGKTVAIVGAGNSANDAIATAIRQGAKDVIQLIRRPKEDYGPMNDYAHQEANAVFDHDIRNFSTKVAALNTDNEGKLTSLVLNANGEEKTVDADLLIIASGFSGAEEYCTEGLDEAACENVFKTGDMVIGSSLVVQAMANAHEVARQVDTYLEGYSNIV